MKYTRGFLRALLSLLFSLSGCWSLSPLAPDMADKVFGLFNENGLVTAFCVRDDALFDGELSSRII